MSGPTRETEVLGAYGATMTDGADALKKIVTNAGRSAPITGSDVQRVSELLDTINESLVKAHIANAFTNPEDPEQGSERGAQHGEGN